MPQMKKASAPPPPQVQKVKKYTNVGVMGRAVKHPSQRKRPIESLVYGDEIWEPQIKKEKEIVVCFYPFTKNNLRISTCGKFIIERFNYYFYSAVIGSDVSVNTTKYSPDIPVDITKYSPEELPKLFNWEVRWNLFYFKTPISDFKPPEDPTQFANIEYQIGVDYSEKFDNLEAVKILSDKVIELVRKEFFEERQNRIQDLKDLDEKLKEERELAEKAESEEEFDELDSGITESSIGESINSENSATLSGSEENEEISSKTE